MALLTTTIGAYPKPDYVPTPDWFREGGTGISNPTEAYQKYLANCAVAIPTIWTRKISKRPTSWLTFSWPGPSRTQLSRLSR